MVLTFFAIMLIISICFNIQQYKALKSLKPKRKTKKVKITKDIKRYFDNMDNMSGEDFERVCCAFLALRGYTDIRITSVTGDFGLDILCTKDKKTYGIQCKCYNHPVGVDAVMQAYAGSAYYDRKIPVVLTNNHFTQAAVDMSAKLGVQLWSKTWVAESLKIFKRENRRGTIDWDKKLKA